MIPGQSVALKEHIMSKVIDITGERFGIITILRRVENTKDGKAQFEYLCDCGNIKIGRGKDIRNGKIVSCGCKKKQQASKNQIDIAGKTYNDLTAIEYDHTEESGRVIWLFKCNNCGKKVLKGKSDVISGKTTNCGCKTSLLRSKGRRVYEKPGAIYNFLQVTRPAFKEEDLGDTTYWYKCLLCGKEVKLFARDVRSGNTKSCGCLISFKEKEIEQLLQKNNINYKTQYTFSDLLSEKHCKLRFDFGLLNDKKELVGLIEYQGEQHFKENCRDFGKLQREITDKQKVEYCNKNNIPLLVLTKENNLEKDILNFYNEVI